MCADRVNIKQEGGSDDLTSKGMTKVDISNRPVKFSICVNIYKALTLVYISTLRLNV